MANKLYVSKRNKIALSINCFLFLFGGLCNLFFDEIIPNINTYIIPLYIAEILFWMFYINKHIIHKQIKNYMTATGICMVIYLVTSLVKYDGFYNIPNLGRHLWYFYYIPMLVIPYLLFCATLNIGKYEDNPLTKKVHLLLIPLIILCTMVMANDSLQLAFKIPDLNNYDDYSHGVGYYFCVVWISFLLIASFSITIKKSYAAISKKYILIPLSTTFFTIAYYAHYFTNTMVRLWNVAEIFCFMIVGLWEGLALIRVIPTNEGYEFFYKNSSMSSFITDEENNVLYASTDCIKLDKAVIEEAKEKPVIISDGIKLTGYKIHGGYSYSISDIRKIDEIRLELERQKDSVMEVNELLKLDNELKHKNEVVKNKEEFYSVIYLTCFNELQTIDHLISNLDINSSTFVHDMRLTCVLNAYIKRLGNLIILGKQFDYISSLDLNFSIKESLSYLELYGVDTGFLTENGKRYKSDIIILMYQAFGLAIEYALPELTSVMVNITDSFIMKVSIDDFSRIIPSDIISSLKYIKVDYEINDNTIIYSFKIKDGD